jgi:hypothetical protein
VFLVSIIVHPLKVQSFEPDFFAFDDTTFTLPPSNNEETFESPNSSEIVNTPVEKSLFTASHAEVTQIITSINGILNHLSSFIAKVNSLPEIDKQIAIWISSKEIPKDSIKNWSELLEQIQLLQTSLTRLKIQDPLTKEYRYIGYLIMDKKAFSALTDLQKKLAIEDAFVPDSYFGLVKLSTKSKDALQKIISTLITVISHDKIISLLNTLMEKFEPQAQKLLAEEKKAAAQAGAKKIIHPTVLQTFGSQASSFGGLDYSDFAGYNSFNFPSSSSSSYWPSTTTPDTTPPVEQKKSTPSSSTSKGPQFSLPDKKDKNKEKDKKKEFEKYVRGNAEKKTYEKPSQEAKTDTQLKRNTFTDSLPKKKIQNDTLETLVTEFNSALNLAYALMFSDREQLAAINPLAENINATMFLPDKEIRYTLIAQNVPQFYTLCEKIITLLPPLSKKLSTVSSKIQNTIQQQITADWIMKNTHQETKENAGFVKWLQNYMQLIKKEHDTPTPIGNEQKEAYFWNPTPPDSPWKEPVIATPSDMKNSKELKTLFDQELERIEQTDIRIDDDDKQLYQEVKDQITDENIQAWLEQKKILIHGKPSTQYNALPTYLRIALDRARENSSLAIIKEIRRVSLFDVASILMKTKTAIERFTGKPIALAIPPLTDSAGAQPETTSV